MEGEKGEGKRGGQDPPPHKARLISDGHLQEPKRRRDGLEACGKPSSVEEERERQRCVSATSLLPGCPWTLEGVL